MSGVPATAESSIHTPSAGPIFSSISTHYAHKLVLKLQHTSVKGTSRCPSHRFLLAHLSMLPCFLSNEPSKLKDKICPCSPEQEKNRMHLLIWKHQFCGPSEINIQFHGFEFKWWLCEGKAIITMVTNN